MYSNEKRNGFGLAAGIILMISAILHGWLFITAVSTSGRVIDSRPYAGAVVLICCIFGIVTAVLFMIMGIILVLGESRLLMGFYLTLGILCATAGTLLLTAIGANTRFLIAAFGLGFYSTAFFILSSETRKLERTGKASTSWYLPIIYYGIGTMIWLVFSIITITTGKSEGARRGGGYIMVLVFVVFGSVLVSIIMSGLYIHKRSVEASFRQEYYPWSYDYHVPVREYRPRDQWWYREYRPEDRRYYHGSSGSRPDLHLYSSRGRGRRYCG